MLPKIPIPSALVCHLLYVVEMTTEIESTAREQAKKLNHGFVDTVAVPVPYLDACARFYKHCTMWYPDDGTIIAGER